MFKGERLRATSAWNTHAHPASMTTDLQVTAVPIMNAHFTVIMTWGGGEKRKQAIYSDVLTILVIFGKWLSRHPGCQAVGHVGHEHMWVKGWQGLYGSDSLDICGGGIFHSWQSLSTRRALPGGCGWSRSKRVGGSLAETPTPSPSPSLIHPPLPPNPQLHSKGFYLAPLWLLLFPRLYLSLKLMSYGT